MLRMVHNMLVWKPNSSIHCTCHTKHTSKKTAHQQNAPAMSNAYPQCRNSLCPRMEFRPHNGRLWRLRTTNATGTKHSSAPTHPCHKQLGKKQKWSKYWKSCKGAGASLSRLLSPDLWQSLSPAEASLIQTEATCAHVKKGVNNQTQHLSALSQYFEMKSENSNCLQGKWKARKACRAA